MNTTQISYAKIFLFGIITQDWTYTDAGAGITLAPGTVMGIIPASDKCFECKSDASNGSQVPYGVLISGRTIAAGETVTLTLCVAGQVRADQLIFLKSGDTLATTMSVGGDVQGTMKSVLTKGGVLPVPSTEQTFGDN